jgi:hypothetical protein
MSKKESKWLAFAIDPKLNAQLVDLCQRERRSKANLARIALEEYCKNKLSDEK